MVIWGRKRKSQLRTVAGTTHSSHLSTAHSNPGKMARRRDCARGACVHRAEAGGGAKRARAPPKFEGPISGLNDPAVFALRSQGTVPFLLTVLAGITIPIFLRRTQIHRMAAGLWLFLDVKHASKSYITFSLPKVMSASRSVLPVPRGAHVLEGETE